MKQSDFLTENIQLSNFGVIGLGDMPVGQAESLAMVGASQNATEQIGVVALGKVSTDVYGQAMRLSKLFPKQQRTKIIAGVLKDTSLSIRELEKDEKYAESKRGVWASKLKQLANSTIDKMQANQVGIVVHYISNGGHAVLSREMALMIRDRYKGLHFVNVISKPFNDPLCEQIYENNKEFCIREGLLSVEFDTELTGNSFAPKNYINNKNFFGLLNEAKTGVNRSAPDTLRLMEIRKHFKLKVDVVANAQYRKHTWFGSKIYNHRDITADAIQRGLENIGICTKCVYSIVGNTTEEQVKRAIRYIGKGQENFDLNYRLLPTPKRMDTILIGKYEPC